MLDGWLKAVGIKLGRREREVSLIEAEAEAPHGSALAAIGRELGSNAEAPVRSRDFANLRKLSVIGAGGILACGAIFLLWPGESGARAPEGQRLAAASAPALQPAPALPQKPAFVPVIRPLHLFALEAPELIKAGANYDAIRATNGDGREDSLSFGTAARSDALFMQLSVYRVGTEVTEPTAFFVDITRRAASVGLAVAKATPGEVLHTKFGDMETAEMRLSVGEYERGCLAFRRAVPGESLRLAGWYCAPNGAFVGRAGLSCLIDRLALLSAGEDHVLRDGFVAAERRRPSCGKAPLIAASASAAPPADVSPTRLRGPKGR
jgi:hypothetical protein